ncbi:TerC family protein [Thermomicrobium sp. 4228-Ro]|uniref:TerC family protein n=1 Tax=Thermomicrobium sp. 4228-Ro TaxID=2993937 RepID=UPI0022497F9A|nr:TerC family protein [Thermomicrobium sp. 4228-Ro]MCX2727811.1 TerC family protein [Thermomicrobium sp. 4228-Ro]
MITVFLGRLLSIVLIDLVLSGDNALVIGMAAHQLPPRQRRWAIVLGGAGAIALRVLFTALAALLLAIPLLRAMGGLLVGWIGFKLVREESEARVLAPALSLWEAIQTITLADFVMSFDNMLAVGGASHGTVELLAFGLLLSMPLILFGSGVIAALLDRVRWLVWIGVGVLAVTGGRMIVEDPIVSAWLGESLAWPAVGLFSTAIGIVALWPSMRRRLRREQAGGHPVRQDETRHAR